MYPEGNRHQAHHGGAQNHLQGNAGVAAVMFGQRNGQHGGGHGTLHDDDALEFHRTWQIFGQQEEEQRHEAEPDDDCQPGHAKELSATQFRQVIGHDGTDHHERQRNGGLGEPVDHREKHFGRHLGGGWRREAHAQKVQQQRQRQGDERRIDGPPPTADQALARQDGYADGPQGDFDTDVVNEQHANGAGVEQHQAKRQRDVGVIVQPGGEGKGAAGPRLSESGQPGGMPGDPDGDHGGHDADDGREEKVFGPAQGGVAQHVLKDEGRQQDVDADAQQALVGLGGEPAQAPEQKADDHQAEHGQDGTKHGGKLVHG